MTQKGGILAAVRGENSDTIPWAPRMDLWFIANRARGTLPFGCTSDMNTVDIAAWLGTACHAVRADFTQPRQPKDLMLHGLGLDNHPDYPYHVELLDLPVDFSNDEENLSTIVETPEGKVSFHLLISEQMKKEGNSLPFVKSYPIESIDDIDAVASLFDHIRVVPAPEKYEKFRRRIGDKGVAVANGVVAASPIHLMLHNLIAMDRFYYLYHDESDSLYELAEHIERVYSDILKAVMMSSAEMFLWGGNFDRDLTWPPFFKKEILPWLQKAAKCAHENGKYLVTHTDGENSELLSFYLQSGMDVIESVCPAPMTMLRFDEILTTLNGAIAVWGGIPAVNLLPGTMSSDAFTVYINKTVDQLKKIEDETGRIPRLILGVSDNVPPDADINRLREITEKLTEAP